MARSLKMVLLEALLACDGRTTWLIGGGREKSDLLACVGEEVDGRRGFVAENEEMDHRNRMERADGCGAARGRDARCW
ncbi:hypothetical protein ACLOJK_038849 [Asimina triloba]